ncbi:MAG: alkaline phosphatase [Clostridia bacterium]|nr:alkaline phosphatase [Clostridia bacterium]
MKKILSVLLVLAIVFSLAGCGNNGAEQTPSQNDTTVYLNGTALSDYTIVIAKDADTLSSDAASILKEYVLRKYEIELTIRLGSAQADKKEIIIGDVDDYTIITDLPEGHYLLTASDDDVYALGDSYLVGGGVGDMIANYISVGNSELKVPQDKKATEFKFQKADSAILMIGDGMGENHIKAAYQEKTIDKFLAEDFPNICHVNTNNANFKTTDSAASGTAMATGVKTTNGFLGLSPSEKRLTNLSDVAYKNGSKVSIVTTDSLYGATPSAFVAHVNDRSNTDVIKMHFENALSKGWIQYAKGSLKDEDFLSTAAEYLWNISENGQTFFTMMEEAYTDKGSHSNDMAVVTHAVSRLNRLVSYCTEYTVIFPRIALIITADHETGGIKPVDNKYKFHTTNHTETPVKLFAMGEGTERLTSSEKIQNTDIAHFIAAILGETKLNK